VDQKTLKTLKIIRIFSQVAFFTLFSYIFFRSMDPFNLLLNPFLRYDPLVYLTHLKLDITIIAPVMGILLLTLILGRFFCGWVCPLGSLIDLLDIIVKPVRKIIAQGKKGNRHIKDNSKLKVQMVKYPFSWFLMGVVIITIFFTPPVLQFFHPHIWIIRIFSLSSAGLIYLGLLTAMSFLSARLWCKYLCPLGAFYGLLSRVSLYRLKINNCTQCKRCIECPMDAAIYIERSIITHQCTLCFNFEYRCPAHGFIYRSSFSRASIPRVSLSRLSFPWKFFYRISSPRVSLFRKILPRVSLSGANSIGFEKQHVSRNGAEPEAKAVMNESPSGLSRREFLKSSTLITGGLIIGTFFSVIDKPRRTDLLRPPGVHDEKEFVQRCLRCFQCVRSCPNRIIKITGIEKFVTHGLDSFLTPHLQFNEYGCDYYCQVCQQVCPNFAIPMQTLEEKQKARIGLAAINQELCVVFAEDKNCLVCEEFCPIPQKAIKIEERIKLVNDQPTLLRYPIVDEPLCIGCGICEAKCPVVEKAIRVFQI